MMKHDLQVNNVVSEICTEYDTQGIQNREWKEAIVAHCKSSNWKGVMIDFSLKTRLNSIVKVSSLIWCEFWLKWQANLEFPMEVPWHKARKLYFQYTDLLSDGFSVVSL